VCFRYDCGTYVEVFYDLLMICTWRLRGKFGDIVVVYTNFFMKTCLVVFSATIIIVVMTIYFSAGLTTDQDLKKVVIIVFSLLFFITCTRLRFLITKRFSLGFLRIKMYKTL
jgi:hypothetical protein